MVANSSVFINNSTNLLKVFAGLPNSFTFAPPSAEVAELVDAHDSKSCAERRAGSIPASGTKPDQTVGFLFYIRFEKSDLLSPRHHIVSSDELQNKIMLC